LLAGTINAFEKDYGGYPGSCHAGAPVVSFGGTDGRGWADAHGHAAFLPRYVQEIPPYDGWKWPYFYDAGPDSVTDVPALGEPVALHFTLCSWGSDRADGGGVDAGVGSFSSISAEWCIGGTPVNVGTEKTHCYQTDIVWGDTGFLQRPGGVQRRC